MQEHVDGAPRQLVQRVIYEQVQCRANAEVSRLSALLFSCDAQLPSVPRGRFKAEGMIWIRFDDGTLLMYTLEILKIDKYSSTRTEERSLTNL